MSKLDHKTTMFRYTFIFVIMTAIAIAVIVKAGYIMTAERDYWLQVSDRVKADSVVVKAPRGNILSCKGEILASTLPEYYLYVDFNAMYNSKTDTLWEEKEDSICEGLHKIFPTRSVEEFRSVLREGREKKSMVCKIWPERVSYDDYIAVSQLPIFRLHKFKGGFYVNENTARRNPYGSIARRTIGEMFSNKDSAKCGIELSFDKYLRGTDGLTHKRKLLDKYVPITDEPTINGADVVTTIDVEMQDIADQALRRKLKEPNVNGETGVVILMEVETGDVKAIVNLSKDDKGEYRERINNAINYRCEPGSVFKPASILVALDDGVCDTNTIIHTGNGVVEMHSRKMKDTHGYYDITLAKAIKVSSNVGVSTVIDNNYSKDPNKFIEGLDRVGIGENLHLPIDGYNPPVIGRFELNAKGAAVDKTRLPWMSIGYNTQIAPINTITFYNAIANNGKMVKPRFVTKIVRDGVTIEEYPTEVLREHIAKPSSIKKMQDILRQVVSQGTGKGARSKLFDISGKTGTAQVSKGAKGYKNSGPVDYWLTFVGFFPSDAPRYSCIVCIKKKGMPASGGSTCGPVFKEIAEGVMAADLVIDVASLRQDEGTLPEVKRGNVSSADYILSTLDIKTLVEGSNANPTWGTFFANDSSSMIVKAEEEFSSSAVPDVIGMGARDAVYVLESCGLKVQLQGRGSVRHQSLAPGSALKAGDVCVLSLSI